MPTDVFTGTQLSKLSSWFADARTRPVRNILSLVPVDQRAGIAAATSVYPIGPAMMAASAIPGIWAFPKGDYILNTDSQVRMLTPDVGFVFQPGARLLLQDGGASNPLIIQDTTNILLEGFEIIDQRTTKSGAGITIYNSTKVTVQKVTVADFALYGIVASDNPEGVFVLASTISYSGNTISDSANGLGVFAVGQQIGISGSLYNNHIYDVVSVAVGGGSLDVTQALITETAGASRTYAESNTISFNATTKRVGSPNPLFQSFKAGDQAAIAGATNGGNNQTVDILDVDIDGDGFTTEQALVTEAAGATVTVTKIGRSRIQVMDMAAIDDLTIDHVTVRNCGHIGIEVFPKVKSKNLVVTFNDVSECGKSVTGGCGIKASQGYINAKVTDNNVCHNQIGMIITSWDTAEVSRNHVLNNQKHGMAIGVGDHIRYIDATYGTLQMHGNIVGYTTDMVTGEPYESDFSYPAINLTGTKVSTGLIDIAFNDVHNYPAGLTCKYILRSHPNLSFRYNKVKDSGSSVLIPVFATADMVSGSPILTNVYIGSQLSVGGFAIGSEIHGSGIPANTFVIDVDGPGKTITMGTEDGTTTVNATETHTRVEGPPLVPGVEIYSAYLDGAELIGNEFTNTDDSKNLTVQVYSTNAKILRNIQNGMGAYGLTVGGSGLIMGARFVHPNPTLIANRGVILLATAGDWQIHDIYADVSMEPTALQFMINNTQPNNAGSVVNTTMVRASEEWVRPLFAVPSGVEEGVFGSFGKNRMTYGADAPADLTRNRYQGDVHLNGAVTTAKAIALWHCITTGSAGQIWRALGVGTGTTAQRPTLTTFSAGFLYWDTTTKELLYWNGTAFQVDTVTVTTIQTITGAKTFTGDLYFNTGQRIKRTTVANANYTALNTDLLIAYTSLTAARTVTLPTAASALSGRIYMVKDESGSAGTFNIIVDGNGAELIDGAASVTITAAYGKVSLYSTGSTWFLL